MASWKSPVISLHVSKSVQSTVITLAGASAGYFLWKWLDNDEDRTRKRGKRKKQIPGLLNVGNSCFMNVLLQAFASCPSFVKWLEDFLKDTSTDKDHVYLAQVVMKILRILTGEEEVDDYYFDPSELLQDMHGRGWQISSQEQDAHEFYHAVMTTLIEEYRHHVENKMRTLGFFEVDELLSSPHQNSHASERLPETKVAEQFSTRRHYPSFRGTLANVLQCQSCGYKHPIRYDGFDSLSLPLPSDPTWMAQITLADCLRGFMAAELVNNVECINCARIRFADEKGWPAEPNSQVSEVISNTLKELSDVTNPNESTAMSTSRHDCSTSTAYGKFPNDKDSNDATGDIAADGRDIILGKETSCEDGNRLGESFDINTRSDIISDDVTSLNKPSADGMVDENDAINTHDDVMLNEPAYAVTLSDDIINPKAVTTDVTKSEQSDVTRCDSDVIKLKEQLDIPSDSDVISNNVTSTYELCETVSSENDESQSIAASATTQKDCDINGTQDIRDRSEKHCNDAQDAGVSNDARRFGSNGLKLPFPKLAMTSQKDSFDNFYRRRHYHVEHRSERLVYPAVKRSFQRCLSFGKLPDCLCMHIQRLVWKQGTPLKKMNYVRFPEILDVGPFTEISRIQRKCPINEDSFAGSLKNLTPREMQKALIMRRAATSSGVNSDVSVPKNPPLSLQGGSEPKSGPSKIQKSARKHALYRLMSVIVHVGDWSFSGHFLAYRRSPKSAEKNNESEWVFTSDTLVRKATREEVFSCPAYILFYERIKP